MRRCLIFGFVLIISLTAFPPSVHACSCAPFAPIEALEQSDAAFVGTFLGEQGMGPNGNVINLFEVEKWVKGDLGAQVGVLAASDGAACGLEVGLGQRVAIYLTLENGTPHSGLCSTGSADSLLAAIAPIRLDGTGPLRFLVGGGFGPMRLMAFDRQGGLLGFGGDENGLDDFSVCPGSKTLVELTAGHLAVRDLTTFEEVDRFDLSLAPDEFAGRVWCRAEDGSESLVQSEKFVGETVSKVLSRFRRDVGEILLEGDFVQMEVGASAVVVVTGPIGEKVLAVDLTTRRETVLSSFQIVDGEALSYGSVWLSPSGEQVAIETFRRSDGPAPGNTKVVDLSGRVLGGIGPYTEQGVAGWLSDSMLTVSTWVEPAETLIYDVPSFTVLNRLPGYPFATTFADDRLVGIVDGSLVAQPLVGGEIVKLKALPGVGFGRLVVVADGPEVTATTQPLPTVPYTAVAPTTLPVTTGGGAATGIPIAIGAGILIVIVVFALKRSSRAG